MTDQRDRRASGNFDGSGFDQQPIPQPVVNGSQRKHRFIQPVIDRSLRICQHMVQPALLT